MRRKIGLILMGLGVLMLVLAPLSRWYAYPRLAVVPDDVAERVSEGRDVTVLDLGAVVSGEGPITRVTDVRSVRKIIPDVDDGTGQVAVWETGVTTFDELGAGATAQENVLSYYEERVAFDRHTAAGVGGRDQYYTPTGDERDLQQVNHNGYYFKLPFLTEEGDYQFWDSTIQQARPMVFAGEDQLSGLPVYRFVQHIEPQPVSAVEVPGALFGQRSPVVADRVYSNTRTIWVEPQTGAIIKGQEEQDSYLEFEGERGPAIIQGSIAYTDQQVAANVDEYAGLARTLEQVRTTLPIAALTAGAVLAIVGLVLARRPHRARRAVREDVEELPPAVAPAGPAVAPVAAPYVARPAVPTTVRATVPTAAPTAARPTRAARSAARSARQAATPVVAVPVPVVPAPRTPQAPDPIHVADPPYAPAVSVTPDPADLGHEPDLPRTPYVPPVPAARPAPYVAPAPLTPRHRVVDDGEFDGYDDEQAGTLHRY